MRYAPPLRAVLVRTVAFVFGASAMWAVLPLIARVAARPRRGGIRAAAGMVRARRGDRRRDAGAASQQFASHDNIVHGAAVLFIAMTVGLAFTHDTILASILMALGGAAWVCAFSVLNVAAQLSVPRWVQGRALAVYQIAVQGGMAGASALWGAVGVRYGLQVALGCGAASMLAGFAVYRWRLAAADEVKPTRSALVAASADRDRHRSR